MKKTTFLLMAMALLCAPVMAAGTAVTDDAAIEKSEQITNFIWIISDTLRRDHLGCYGNEESRTPVLDALAAKSVRFDRQYIASFPTMPSRADYYTGRWTGTFFRGWAPLTDDMVILPEILKDKGLHTVAVVDTPFFIRNGMNYDRGFFSFYDIAGQPVPASTGESVDIRGAWRSEADRLAPRTFTKAMEWLENHYEEDFFLWIDAWDPHEPWDPPDYYTKLYWPENSGEVLMPARAEYKPAGSAEDKVKEAHAFYRGEVTMVDTWLGHLLTRLENMDLMEKTAILFTSDHGTYHGEHGGRFGKHTMAKLPEGATGFRFGYCPLYEEVVTVPLLIYVPGIAPGSYSGLTSAIDLAPTVLDILGQDIPSIMEGRSLLPAMKDPSVAGREYVISAAPFRTDGRPLNENGVKYYLSEDSSVTVTTDEWSLIYSLEPGVSELFNLSSDPKQEKDVIDEHPEVARELHQLLVTFMDEHNVPAELRDPRAELRL
jgi:arylsulfatase A-like enzyme